MISQTIEILDKNMEDLLGYYVIHWDLVLQAMKNCSECFIKILPKQVKLMLYNDKLSLTDSKLPYKYLRAFDFSTPCPLWMATDA